MSDERLWRIGQHYQIHVYEMGEDEDADIPVATALTVEFAKQIVKDHNAQLREPGEEQTEVSDAVSRAVEKLRARPRTKGGIRYGLAYKLEASTDELIDLLTTVADLCMDADILRANERLARAILGEPEEPS